MPYYLGLPIWANPDWVGTLFSGNAKPRDFLPQYCRVFSTVEGNNTFYGLPSAKTVERWCADTPEDFHFCFKFPRQISHDRRLLDARRETTEFLQRLTPLAEQDRLGPLFLQLPPSLGANVLPALAHYLAELPSGFCYAVEPRHPDFFTKGEAEKAFNRLLAERQNNPIDRVVLDSRALFSVPALDDDTRGAQRKKPRLPVRAVALGPRPLVRFIGHPDVAANQPFLTPWIEKIAAWITEGRTPYVFTHTPNNRCAHELAKLFHNGLRDHVTLEPLPAWPKRDSEQLGLL